MKRFKKLVGGRMEKKEIRPSKMFAKLPEEQRDSLFRSIEFLGRHGLHGATIAHFCGISLTQVYQACAKLQIKLRDYRDGKNETSQQVIVKAPVVRLMIREGKEVFGKAMKVM